MIWQYIRRTARVAFTDFAVRTDLINGLVSAVISLLAGPKNKPVSTLTTHDVAVYATMALGAYAFIRAFVVAPYQIWADDQNKLELLQAELNLPDRLLRSSMMDHSIALRKELSAKLAKYVGVTQVIGNKLPAKLNSGEFKMVDYNDYLALQVRIIDILQELSYDYIVRSAGWNIITLCGEIGQTVKNKDIPEELLKRLKHQAKLTFKILHFENPAGQIGAFAELEQYLTEVGDPILRV